MNKLRPVEDRTRFTKERVEEHSEPETPAPKSIDKGYVKGLLSAGATAAVGAAIASAWWTPNFSVDTNFVVPMPESRSCNFDFGLVPSSPALDEIAVTQQEFSKLLSRKFASAGADEHMVARLELLNQRLRSMLPPITDAEVARMNEISEELRSIDAAIESRTKALDEMKDDEAV